MAGKIIQNQYLASMVAKSLAEKMIWDQETQTYWFHDPEERTWSPIVPKMLEKEVSLFIQKNDPTNNLSVNKLKDIIAQIQHYIRTVDRIEDTHLSFDDKQLRLSDLTPVPYAKENFALVRFHFPLRAVDGAPHQLFDKYLRDTCTNAEGNYNALMHDQLQEIAGFVLSNDKAEKAFFLMGSGANGKSPFLDILRALVGKDRCHAAGLAELTTQSFALCDLVGKKLNAKAEEESDKVSLARLKEMISGEPITARRLYEPNFTFHCFTRFIFATNNPPRLDGMDHATRRRFLVIPFEHVMEPKDYDRELSKKIIKDELAYVAKWALDGLRRLRANNFIFTESEESTEAMDELEMENNSALEFLSEKYEPNPHAEMPFASMYAAYAQWCKDFGRKSVKSRKFGRICTKLYGKSSVDREGKSLRRVYPVAFLGLEPGLPSNYRK